MFYAIGYLLVFVFGTAMLLLSVLLVLWQIGDDDDKHRVKRP